MNRALALLLTALALLLPGGAANAQSGSRVVLTTSWVEEWDPASQQWVQVDDNAAQIAPAAFAQSTTVERLGNVTITQTVRAEPARFVARPARAWGQNAGVAQYGPFRVLDGKRAALVATTDADSPQAFAAMLAAYPGLEVIEFGDAPGTTNDLANLKLGRAIRAAGLATHVPEGGSARSGAVELFLAGTRRTMAPRALFAVHSWRDERGREPDDFAADAPENRLYLDYYTEMGMTADESQAFYAMTNSVPHAGAMWLEGTEMARWIAPLADPLRTPAARQLAPRQFARGASGAQGARGALHRAPHHSSPMLAYADLGPELGPAMPLAFAAASLDSLVAFP